MTTINVSMPDTMRAYVEAQAAAGDYSTSEYIRHLIRQDQQIKTGRFDPELLAQLLAISQKQLDDGEVVHITAGEFLAEQRAKYERVSH